MADCEKYQELISLYVDRGISDEEKSELFAHMAQCDDCARLLDIYSEISRLMADEAEPPAELLTGVMDGVQKINTLRSIPKSRARKAVIKWLAVAACAAIILIPAVKFLSGGASKSDNNAASNDSLIQYQDSVGDSVEASDYEQSNAASDNADNMPESPGSINGSISADSSESDNTTGKPAPESGVPDVNVVAPSTGNANGSPMFKASDIADGYYAVVYTGGYPELLGDNANRTVFKFTDGTEGVQITKDELTALEASGEYVVTYYNKSSDIVLMVYNP